MVHFAVFLHMLMGECVCQLAQLSQVTENLSTMVSGTVRFPSKGSEGTGKRTESSDLESNMLLEGARNEQVKAEVEYRF